PLVRLGVLQAGLEAARPAGTGGEAVVMALLVATAVLAADVLLEALVLVGLGLVADVRVGVGRRRLVRRARAGGDVPPVDRDGPLPVHPVLLPGGLPARPLVGLGVLHAGLEAARAAAAEPAGAAADVLAEVLVLVGLGLVGDVRGGVR